MGNVDVFPGNREFNPSNYKSVQIKENEAADFSLFVNFIQPGEYLFHVEIQTNNFWGQKELLSSEPLSLNWVAYEDLSNLIFYERIYKQNIELESCK